MFSPRIRQLIHFIVDRPVATLLIAGALIFVIAAGITQLKTDFGYRVWFPDGNSYLQRFDQFEEQFGSDESTVVVVHSPSGIFDRESIQLLSTLHEELESVPQTLRVDSLINYNWVHAEGDELSVDPLIESDAELGDSYLALRKEIALNHRTLPNYLISEDATTALIFLTCQPVPGGSVDYQTIVSSVNSALEKYQGQGDHQFYVSGATAINDAFREITNDDLSTLLPIVFLLVCLFIYLSFRTLSTVVLTMMSIVISIAVMMGFAGWVGIPIHNLTAITPEFLIAIAVADSVHILAVYFIFRSQNQSHRKALLQSLEKNLIPTLLTSITTAIGFYSFATAGIRTISQMGIVAGTGTLLAWLATYFVLAPLLSLLPLKAKPRTWELKTAEKDGASKSMEGFSQILYQWRYAILAVAGIVAIGTAYISSTNRVNSDPFRYYQDDFHLTAANNFIEAQVGGAQGLELVIDSGEENGVKDPAFLRKVEAYQEWLDSFPVITKTISVVNIVKEMNEALHSDEANAYKLPTKRDVIAQELFLYTMNLPDGMDIEDRVTPEYDKLRLTAMWTVHDSETFMNFVQQAEAHGKTMGLDVKVTGKMLLWQSMNGEVVKAFLTSISLALILVSLILIFALGSVKLGLLAMLPNILPLLMGGAVLKLLGKPLDVGTVIVASAVLGIAVDDTIHVLTNFKRYRDQGFSATNAIARVLTNTGPALVITTLSLVAGFGTFAFAGFVPNQNFGIMLAICLTMALVVDLVVLPALLMVLEGEKKAVKSLPPTREAIANLT